MNIELLYRELGQIKKQIEDETKELVARIEKRKSWVTSPSLPLSDAQGVMQAGFLAAALAQRDALPERHAPLKLRIFELEQKIERETQNK